MLIVDVELVVFTGSAGGRVGAGLAVRPSVSAAHAFPSLQVELVTSASGTLPVGGALPAVGDGIAVDAFLAGAVEVVTRFAFLAGGVVRAREAAVHAGTAGRFGSYSARCVVVVALETTVAGTGLGAGFAVVHPARGTFCAVLERPVSALVALGSTSALDAARSTTETDSRIEVCSRLAGQAERSVLGAF